MKPDPWSEHSNAPHSNVESQRFRVTHPLSLAKIQNALEMNSFRSRL